MVDLFSFAEEMFLSRAQFFKAIALFIATLLAVIFTGLSSTQKAYTTPTSDVITMPGVLRDFKDSHPDFERNPGDGRFAFGLDYEITKDYLGSDGKPIYKGGSYSTTNQTNFDQWYRNVAGINKSTNYSIELKDLDGDGTFTYYNSAFFPLDGMAGFDDQGRSHNYHFTYQIHSDFTYKGGEVFEFRGDDDVWVYINGKKVIDIGGVHVEKVKTVDLDAVASSIGITPGNDYDFDLFFAERHTVHSNFKIETTIAFNNPPVPSGGALKAD